MILLDKNLPVLISAAAFLVICLIFLSLSQLLRIRKKNRRMVERIEGEGNLYAFPKEDISSLTETQKGLSPILRLFRKLGDRFSPAEQAGLPSVPMKFLRAGLRGSNTLAIFWGAKFFMPLALAGVFMSMRLGFLRQVNISLALIVFLSLLGFYLPDLWLSNRSEKRRKRMQEGLPDLLDLLVVCVEAGMGMDAALYRVAEELQLSNPVLSEELKLLVLEIRAGKSRLDALRQLAMRSGLDEVNSLVTLLIQTDKFGTSVAQALRTFSDSFRTARYQRAEEAAAKLPLKLIFPIVFFIFPAFFVVALGPAAVQVYRNFVLK